MAPPRPETFEAIKIRHPNISRPDWNNLRAGDPASAGGGGLMLRLPKWKCAVSGPSSGLRDKNPGLDRVGRPEAEHFVGSSNSFSAIRLAVIRHRSRPVTAVPPRGVEALKNVRRRRTGRFHSRL